MSGLPPVDDRTFRKAYERVLAARPDEIAHVDRAGTYTFAQSFERSLRFADLYVERLAAVANDLTSLRTTVIRGNLDVGKRPELARFRVVPLGELETAGPGAPAEVSASDLIGYLYTSGTTGVSKGVMYRHAHGYTHASRENEQPRPPTDRCLIVLPLFHGAGQMYSLYGSLIQQARCVIEPSFSARSRP